MNAEINSTSITDLPSVGNPQQPAQPQNISMNVSNISQIPNTSIQQMQNQQQQQQQPITSTQTNVVTETPQNYNEVIQNLQNQGNQGNSNTLPLPPQMPQSQQDPSDVSSILKSMEQMAATSNTFDLPSRDIPQQSNREDATAQPNYVPEHKNYINEYEEYENMIDNKRKEENRQSSLETLYEQLQLPIIVALLYFLFHLPVVNNWFVKNFKSFFHSDGNMNLSGYILKSLVFASLYFAFHKGIKYAETF